MTYTRALTIRFREHLQSQMQESPWLTTATLMIAGALMQFLFIVWMLRVTCD